MGYVEDGKTEVQMVGGTEASAGGAKGGGSSARSGDVQTRTLRREGGVQWRGQEPGVGSEAVA